MLEDSKAFRADCGSEDIYGIYATISSQTNIQMFIFSTRASLGNGASPMHS